MNVSIVTVILTVLGRRPENNVLPVRMGETSGMPLCSI